LVTGATSATPDATAATADVLASKDEGEACTEAHELELFFQRIHPVNPYLGVLFFGVCCGCIRVCEGDGMCSCV